MANINRYNHINKNSRFSMIFQECKKSWNQRVWKQLHAFRNKKNSHKTPYFLFLLRSPSNWQDQAYAPTWHKQAGTDKQAALHAGRGSPCLPSLHILLRAGTTAEIPHLPLQEWPLRGTSNVHGPAFICASHFVLNSLQAWQLPTTN